MKFTLWLEVRERPVTDFLRMVFDVLENLEDFHLKKGKDEGIIDILDRYKTLNSWQQEKAKSLLKIQMDHYYTVNLRMYFLLTDLLNYLNR